MRRAEDVATAAIVMTMATTTSIVIIVTMIVIITIIMIMRGFSMFTIITTGMYTTGRHRLR